MGNTINIKNALVNQKPYALLEHSEDWLNTADICFFVDVPTEKDITFALKGTGSVRIYKNGILATELTLQGEETVYTDRCIAGEKAVYCINNANGITELDLHSNHITEFYANREVAIQKLVIYDNALQELNCAPFKKLQFLHMFNNPMCEDRESMETMVESLPDRTAASTGSIIFYPWMGLEILIQEITETDENGNSCTKYVKYPYEPEKIGNYSYVGGTGRLENPRYDWVYENGNYKFEENRLYGIVCRDGGADRIAGYGVYLNDQLVKADSENCPEEYVKYGKCQNLRRDVLENETLPKNWVFGSAIMYHVDWAKCPWDFRQNHIADMWETAEKGFGLTLGTMDLLTLMFPGAKYLNVLSFQDCSVSAGVGGNQDALSEENRNFWEGKRTHGDLILSVICGNGANAEDCPGEVVNSAANCRYAGAQDSQRYGYVPHCKLFLLDNFDADKKGERMERFAELAGQSACDSITTSTGYAPLRDELGDYPDSTVATIFRDATWRESFHNFSKDHILTVGIGNKGDGDPTTEDLYSRYFYDASYGTNHMGLRKEAEGTEKTGVIYACALDRENRVSVISQNSPGAERSKFTTVDYMSQYGQFIPVHKNLLRKGEDNTNELVGRMCYTHGTSYASPILNAMLMLLRIIYTKMILAGSENPEQLPELQSYGKYSPFMDYVREHWCNILPSQMDFAGGFGMPDILAEPMEKRLLSCQPAAGSTDRFVVGEAIQFVYDAEATKDGFTVQCDREMFAVTSENVLYPIRPSAEMQEIVLCSNSARQKVTDGLYGENYYKTSLPVPVVAENTGLEVMPSELVEDGAQSFTILLLVDFLQEITETKPWFAKAVREGAPGLYLEASQGLGNRAGGTFSFTGKRLVWSIKDGNTNLGAEMVCYPLDNYLKKHSAAVIAITGSPAGMQTYFNGNRTSFLAVGEPFSVRYGDIAVNYAARVCAYARALSEEEIIRNTAAILNEYQREEV